jgi:DNA repair exonuclease SbcCD nuclease subunit
MKKIAFITDIHYGVRQNSELFLQMQDKYLYDEFIKYVVDNGIKYIIIGGDVFDCRSAVNIKVLNFVYKFFENLNELKGVTTYCILGNHDSYLTNSNEYHSIKFLKNFEHVILIDEESIVRFDVNTDILMVPWVTDKEKFIKKYTGCGIKTCIGHFPIVGFPMSGGHINGDGIPGEFFNINFTNTISGHFHVKKVEDKIVYPNNPFQFNRSDMGDYDKGFSVLNFNDAGYLDDIEYINSKDIIRFEKVVYPEEIIESKVKGNLIDVFVDYGKDFKEEDFKKYMGEINSFNPAATPEVKILNTNIVDLNNNVNLNNLGSSLMLMNEYIGQQQIDNKKEVSELMINLYDNAKWVE